MTTKAQLEAVYTAYAWNDGRIRKSFACKQGLSLLPQPFNSSRLAFDIDFEQLKENSYGFRVTVHVNLAIDRECFEVFLCKANAHAPLHKPLIVPLTYGFNAQANKLHTAVSGLICVYNVAGVECLEYYPDGMPLG